MDRVFENMAQKRTATEALPEEKHKKFKIEELWDSIKKETQEEIKLVKIIMKAIAKEEILKFFQSADAEKYLQSIAKEKVDKEFKVERRLDEKHTPTVFRFMVVFDDGMTLFFVITFQSDNLLTFKVSNYTKICSHVTRYEFENLKFSDIYPKQ